MNRERREPSARQSPRWSLPEHILGEPVPVCFILARSPTAVVRVQHMQAFTDGFEFQLVAHCRNIGGDGWDPMHGLAGLRRTPGAPSDVLSDDHLRLRLQFADGSNASNLGPPMMAPAERSPSGPFLRSVSGEGGGSMVRMVYWVWPLPPPGPVVFSCEWPSHEIALTSHQIDASDILDAATRATELWPEESEHA